MAKDKKELDDDLLARSCKYPFFRRRQQKGREEKAGRCEKGRKERS